MKDAPLDGVVKYDSNIVALEEFYYYERAGGNLQTLSCNMTSCNFGFLVLATHLTSLNFDELVVGDGYINCRLLTTLSLPKLTRTPTGGGFDFSSAALQVLSIPNLEYIGTFFTMLMPALTTLSVPKLKSIGSITWSLATIGRISLDALEEVHGTITITAPQATSILMPNLKHVDGDIIIHAPQATLVTYPNIKSVGGNVTLDTRLDRAAVSDALAWLDLLNGSNGTTVFSTKIVDVRFNNLHPFVLGQASAGRLRMRGCVVYTN
jgi:hypothetical protein